MIHNNVRLLIFCGCSPTCTSTELSFFQHHHAYKFILISAFLSSYENHLEMYLVISSTADITKTLNFIIEIPKIGKQYSYRYYIDNKDLNVHKMITLLSKYLLLIQINDYGDLTTCCT